MEWTADLAPSLMSQVEILDRMMQIWDWSNCVVGFECQPHLVMDYGGGGYGRGC